MKLREARGTLARGAFRVLLGTLGLALSQATRVMPRLRAQIAEDHVVEIRAADGVAHHYVFSYPARKIRSKAGRPPGESSLSLCFESSGLGLITLINPKAIGKINKLLLARRADYTGNAALVPWFWGLTRMVLPYGRQKPMKEVLHGALIAPNPASKVADRITREPVAEALDAAAWPDALTAHQKMPMVRACAGEKIPMW